MLLSDTQFNWDCTGVLVKKATREYTLSLWVKLSSYDEPKGSYHLPIQLFFIFAWILLSAPELY